MVFKEIRFAILLIYVYIIACQTVLSKKNYYMIEERVNFFQAFLNCENEGMELANVLTVDDEKDLTYLLKDVNKTGDYLGGFWLSGTNLAERNTTNYHWLTGGKRVLYTDWLPGSPYNYGAYEQCIEYEEKGGHTGWHDIDCQEQIRYICQDKTC